MPLDAQPFQTPDLPRFRWPWFTFKVLISSALLTYLLTRADSRTLFEALLQASPIWITAALGLYLAMIAVSVWRWHLLLAAQNVVVPATTLFGSYLVATFFNNFLPSNIGGDVIRIRDTASATGSRTLATTVVAMDRAIGLLGLLLVAASAASLSGVGHVGSLWPSTLWFCAITGCLALAAIVLAPGLTAYVLTPLRRLAPVKAEWIDVRLTRLTRTFSQFRRRPGSLVLCLAGATAVQLVLVGFWSAVAVSADIPVSLIDLGVLIPVSFVVQMIPVSVNGFGVREAMFSFYFVQRGLPTDLALLLSLLGTITTMLFSLSGLLVYLARR